jgi:AcrR family transcriptional regulator
MDRKTQILKAAFDLMADKGLETVHHRTVAKALDINHATIHYYFPTRPDLLVGVADYALSQLRRDRASLGAAAEPREVVENELALAEAYCKPASRMGNVLIGLCAAQRSEPALLGPVGALVRELLTPPQEAARDAKTRKSSPFGEGLLLPELLLGLVLASHLKGDNSQAEAQFNQVFDSLFKA